jgi:hypothetical protein
MLRRSPGGGLGPGTSLDLFVILDCPVEVAAVAGFQRRGPLGGHPCRCAGWAGVHGPWGCPSWSLGRFGAGQPGA